MQPKIFIDSLNKLIKTRHGHGTISHNVITVLPESKSFLKLIDIPLVDESELSKTIKDILPQYIPIDVESNYFDWQILSSTDTSQSILVGACPKNIVDSYVSALNEADLLPVILEVEAAAIARTLVPENHEKPQIIIDIGAHRTGLYLYHQGTIKFTVSLPISGNKMTDHISETLELNFAQAEKAKIVCGLDKNKCHGALLEIFSDTIDNLSRQITQAIRVYDANFHDQEPIENVVLCGGGANFINITQILQERLKIPVVISNPWQFVINPNEKYFTKEKSQSFITAFGLAMRGLHPQTYL